MFSSTPMVSIVIPCYNAAQYIGETLESALNQTHRPIEIIVVDDGSTDNSIDVVRGFPDVRLLTQANSGASVARNNGIQHAQGEFLLLLDADDRLLPHAVEVGLRVFSEHSDANMIYGSFYLINADGDRIGENKQEPKEFGLLDVATGVTPCPSLCLFRREPVVEAGLFDPGIRFTEDIDLYLRLTENAPGFCHGEYVAEYRQHAGQLTKRPAEVLIMLLHAMDKNLTDEKLRPYGSSTSKVRAHWKRYSGQFMLQELLRNAAKGKVGAAGRVLGTYLAHAPDTMVGTVNFIGRKLKGGGAKAARA